MKKKFLQIFCRISDLYLRDLCIVPTVRLDLSAPGFFSTYHRDFYDDEGDDSSRQLECVVALYRCYAS